MSKPKKTAAPAAKNLAAQEREDRVTFASQAAVGMTMAKEIALQVFASVGEGNDLLAAIVPMIYDQLVWKFDDDGNPPETADEFIAELEASKRFAVELYGADLGARPATVLSVNERLHVAFDLID